MRCLYADRHMEFKFDRSILSDDAVIYDMRVSNPHPAQEI